jgi:hypothetical protein
LKFQPADAILIPMALMKTVMPWKKNYPSPKHWFNKFGRDDPKTGQNDRGNTTAGSPL